MLTADEARRIAANIALQECRGEVAKAHVSETAPEDVRAELAQGVMASCMAKKGFYLQQSGWTSRGVPAQRALLPALYVVASILRIRRKLLANMRNPSLFLLRRAPSVSLCAPETSRWRIWRVSMTLLPT